VLSISSPFQEPRPCGGSTNDMLDLAKDTRSIVEPSYGNIIAPVVDETVVALGLVNLWGLSTDSDT
jgi:hypothetical protein